MGKQPSPYSRAGSGDDSRSKATSSYAPRSKRDNFGCLTCRVRRKKCKEPTGDDTKPCESCQRNGVECLGYPGLSPSWASRNQNRLRECALRSKLWIELSKGSNRATGSVLDLSFYKKQNVPLELSEHEIERLHALEWQAYLHASDPKKPPQCPRPDWCHGALTVDQLIRRDLIQVHDYQPFPQFRYVDSTSAPPRKRATTVPSPDSSARSSPAPSNSRSGSAQPSASVSATTLTQQETSHFSPLTYIPSNLYSPGTTSTPLTPEAYSRDVRILPPPAAMRQSLTDSGSPSAPYPIRRREAFDIGGPPPARDHTTRSASPWMQSFEDPIPNRPSGPSSRRELTYHNPLPDPLYSISPLDNNHFAPPRRSTTLPNPQMHHTLLGHDRNLPPPSGFHHTPSSTMLSPHSLYSLPINPHTSHVRSASPGVYINAPSSENSSSVGETPSSSPSEDYLNLPQSSQSSSQSQPGSQLQYYTSDLGDYGPPPPSTSSSTASYSGMPVRGWNQPNTSYALPPQQTVSYSGIGPPPNYHNAYQHDGIPPHEVGNPLRFPNTPYSGVGPLQPLPPHSSTQESRPTSRSPSPRTLRLQSWYPPPMHRDSFTD